MAFTDDWAMPKGSSAGGALGCLSFVLVFLGAVAGLFLLPALLCALLVFGLLRGVLGRRDWILVLLAGAAGFSWYFSANLSGYSSWMASFLDFGPAKPQDVPIVSILCLAAALSGLAGAWIGSRRIKSVPILKYLLSWNRVEDPAVTPGEARREALKRKVAKNVPMAAIPAVRGPHATAKARLVPVKDKSMPIGLGKDGRLVQLSTAEMGMHGCVVGSTGSGKTVTLMWIIGAALDMGFDVTVIDMKEDTEPGGLRDFLRAYSTMHQVQMQEIALGDQRPAYWFNVLAGMTADEAFDTIMSLVEFDDAYWQALNRKILQQVIQLLFEAAEVSAGQFSEPTMYEIGKILELGPRMKDGVKDRVLALDRVYGVNYCMDRYTNVLKPSDDESKSAASFGTKLTGLYDSGAGPRILTPAADRAMVDVRLEGLTYIGLNSLGQPDMAKILSSSALQRLSVYAAERIQGRAPKERPRLIVVDEANFIARDIAMNMLSRVRSALFSMILCTQGPTDWIDENGDDWSRLTQNINWLIAMAQSSPEAAEKCAEFLGMDNTNQIRQQIVKGRAAASGMISAEEVYLVPIQDLRALGRGEGFLRVNKPHSRVSYVCMPYRGQELSWYESQNMASR